MDSAAERKRKASSEESEASTSSILMARKTRRRLVDSTASDRVSSSSSCCLSPSDDDGLASSSKSADLEQRENENGFTVAFTATSPCDSSNCSGRRETSEVDGGEVEPRLGRVVGKMPSEAELEEFFAAAEKAIQKKFIDKYNFDVVKDEPLEGRYEWVQLSKAMK